MAMTARVAMLSAFSIGSSTMVAIFQAAGLIVASPFVGSFVGTIVDRIPRDESFLWVRSKCRSCGGTLLAHDLVPIGSYLALRGCCRRCGVAIPRELLALELSFVVATIGCVQFVPADNVFAAAILAWFVLALAWCDICHGRLPNLLTLPLGVCGLAWALVVEAPVIDRLLGVSIGFLLPASAASIYRLWRGRDGLGFGDVKLFAALGAWVGWEAVPIILLLSSVIALMFVILSGRMSSTRSLRFGPFIAFAGWATWAWTQGGQPS
jgi:leader peptidase (prepilin peptidase) / N-methyltransferase